MTVRTAYARGLQDGSIKPDPDDLVIGVVNHEMYGIEDVLDRNVEALAPPKDLFEAYKRVEEAADREIAWRSVRFEDRYLDYIESNPSAQHALEHVAELAAGRTVWLVCYEANDRFCHRRLLRNWIEGIDGPAFSGDISEPCDREEHGYVRDRGMAFCPDCEVSIQSLSTVLDHDPPFRPASEVRGDP